MSSIVVVEEEELKLVGVIKAFQDIAPLRASPISEVGHEDIADRLDARAGACGEQPVKAGVELNAKQHEERRGQQDEVQEEPEQDFGVEGKAQFHVLSASQPLDSSTCSRRHAGF